MLQIMVVDDDEISRDLIEHTLTSAGYGVATFANGGEALEALRDGQFRLVISDWDMPIMSGVELCRAVRCHWDYRCASDDTRWSWWIEADGGKLGAGFTILDEDGDRYCRGLVLAIADLPVVPPEAMP